MVLNATFNNILDLSWQSVLLVEETRAPGKNHYIFEIFPHKYLCVYKYANSVEIPQSSFCVSGLTSLQ
jgi:hypothetical protein